MISESIIILQHWSILRTVLRQIIGGMEASQSCTRPDIVILHDWNATSIESKFARERFYCKIKKQLKISIGIFKKFLLNPGIHFSNLEDTLYKCWYKFPKTESWPYYIDFGPVGWVLAETDLDLGY